MPLELKELTDLIEAEGGDDSVQEAVETAIQALLFHQAVYDDTHQFPRESLRLLRSQRSFFEKYFAVAGYHLIVDNQAQMVALQRRSGAGAPYGWGQMRLRKDETLVRMALRMILDDGWRSGSMDEAGRVGTDTDELVDMFKALSGVEPPQEGRLGEILKSLARFGAVRVGTRDKAERVTDITVLPGIRVHVPDPFVRRIVDWIERGRPGDLFEHIAEKKREETLPVSQAVLSGDPDDDISEVESVLPGFANDHVRVD